MPHPHDASQDKRHDEHGHGHGHGHDGEERLNSSCPAGDDLLDSEIALARVIEATPLLAEEEVPILEALGRVLARDAVAREDIPLADKSAMDGFALRSADTAAASASHPAVLEVREMVTAGEVASQRVEEGVAIRIMTGAPLPEGSDCVVPWERTEDRESGQKVAIKVSTRPGDNVVPRAADVEYGTVVLEAPTRLRPQEIGVLASLGYPRAMVRCRPRVLVMATGNELIRPEEPMSPGKVRSSNTYTLLTQARMAGADAIDLGLGVDKLEDIVRTIENSLPADVVITSGGSAQGVHDHTARVFEKLGCETRFHRVAIKPGKPVIFATKGNTLFFGLPGNPVASMVSFELFVRPALLRMQGHSQLVRPRVRATLTESLRHEPVKRTFMRGILSRHDEELRVRTTGNQGSGLLTSMARANCLIRLESGRSHYEAGSRVQVILFDSPEVADEGQLA